MPPPVVRPWLSPTAARTYAEHQERYRTFEAAAFRGEVDALLADQTAASS